MNSVVLVFDGHCGFCTRFVQWLIRQDHHARLEVFAWQQPEVLDRTGLTRAQVRNAAWCQYDGRWYRGAAAVEMALAVVTGRTWIMGLHRIPVIAQLQNLGYAWIAQHRHWFRGVAPYCRTATPPCRH
jgi:predicted DCC family thiol-disulfide oxidoreductase YuxK